MIDVVLFWTGQGRWSGFLSFKISLLHVRQWLTSWTPDVHRHFLCCEDLLNIIYDNWNQVTGTATDICIDIIFI